MAGNVWDALARELREMKRVTEGMRDQLDTANEKLADLSARIEEARKGNATPKENDEPGTGSVSDY